MKEVKKIKDRINKRKKNKLKIFNLICSIMTIYVLFMSFAIYAKKDQNAILFNTIFNTDINFTNFNTALNKLIDLRIVTNNDIDGYDQVVSQDVVYVNVGEDFYVSEGNIAISLDDGLVTYVNGKDDNYTVIVEYNKGIRATYNYISEVNVFVNDRLYKDDIIGVYNEKVEIIFIKDSEKITYEEVISII